LIHAQMIRNAMEHAVRTGNDEVLDSLALQLSSCAVAMEVMRAKGYGTTGETIDIMVKRVPANVLWYQEQDNPP
jgi:hypothetical protein